MFVFFSTLWALRALNAAGQLKPEMLREMVSFWVDGKIGFRHGDNRMRLSTSSQLLTLISELPIELREEIFEFVSGAYLAKKVAQSIDINFVEVEEYFVPPAIFGGVEKLSWTHISGAIAWEALGKLRTWYPLEKKTETQVKASLYKQLENFSSNGCFIPQGVISTEEDPVMFPTAYFIIGASQWLKNL